MEPEVDSGPPMRAQLVDLMANEGQGWRGRGHPMHQREPGGRWEETVIEAEVEVGDYEAPYRLFGQPSFAVEAKSRGRESWSFRRLFSSSNSWGAGY